VPEQKAGSLPLADEDRPETAADVGIDRPQFLDAFRCELHAKQLIVRF
jgi:hypothetical protein